MAEGGGGQFDATQQVPRKSIGWKNLARRVTEGIRNEFGGDRRMPAEEIQDSTVAYTIYRHLRNPLRGNVPGYNPFIIADVMANAGYVTPLRDTDLRTKFPDAYFRFRDALKN